MNGDNSRRLAGDPGLSHDNAGAASRPRPRPSADVTTRQLGGIFMPVSRRLLLGGAAALSATPIMRARAQGKPTIKLGVLTDLSGTYRDNTGPTSVAAAQQAIDEMRAAHRFRCGADQRRPSEQARCGLYHRAAMVRPGGRCDDRRADLLGGARGGAGGEGEGQDHAQRVGHRGGVDLAAVQSELDRLELRHLRERAQHRRRADGGRATSPGPSSPRTTPSASRWRT